MNEGPGKAGNRPRVSDAPARVRIVAYRRSRCPTD